jgi:ankyrin repeat protein
MRRSRKCAFNAVFSLGILSFFIIGAALPNPNQELIAAVKKGSLSEVQRIINAANLSSINEPLDDSNQTILHLSAGKYGKYPDSPAICRALIKAGADKNALDIDAFTPVSHAIYESNDAVVESLLQAGADPNRGAVMGDSLLIATQKNNLHVVRLLISAGADVKGKKGGPSLSAAAQAGYVDIEKTLIQTGVNTNAVDNANSTALHWWCFNSTHDLDALRVLLSNGANVNAVDKWGRTPIMQLLTSENEMKTATLLTALKALIAAGADTSVKSTFGDSAMSLGLKSTNTEVASFFRDIQRKSK